MGIQLAMVFVIQCKFLVFPLNLEFSLIRRQGKVCELESAIGKCFYFGLF